MHVTGDAVDPQTAIADRVEMGSARDQAHVGAIFGQARADVCADTSGSEYGYAHDSSLAGVGEGR